LPDFDGEETPGFRYQLIFVPVDEQVAQIKYFEGMSANPCHPFWACRL